MAANQKKTTRKKKSTKPTKNPFSDEITLVSTLVISVLLILSYFNKAGKVGEVINQGSFGLFGYLAYLFPIAMFIGVAFGISNRKNKVAKRKLISSIAFFVVLTAVLHLMSYGNSARGLKIVGIFKVSATDKNGGGVLGGIICNIFLPLFDILGTYIILFAVLVILVMLITEKFLFASLGKKSGETLENMKERRRQYLEEREQIMAQEMKLQPQENHTQRRKAKTFTFSKEEQVIDDVETKEVPKAKKKVSKKVESVKQNFDMEEVVPEKIMDFPIHRASQENTAETTKVEPVYETELKNKFNPQSEEMTEIIKEVIEAPDMGPWSNDNEPINYDADDSFEPMKEIVDVKPKKEKVTQTKEEKEKDIQSVAKEVKNKKVEKRYQIPPLDLLSKPQNNSKGMSDLQLKETAMKLQSTLDSFGVKVTITNVSCGPSVTRYELQPEQGVKVSRITNLADDIKLNLAAADVRIEAPIPGKAAVGIEVPNSENSLVTFRELIESKEFKNNKSNLSFAVGKDIGGQTVVTDIAKMPHLLIAGATGSGKSVCINTLIMSIIYKADPNDVKLIMVDPKVVELSVYNGIPHLMIPVVTDPKKASAALNWAVMEMTDRYNKFAELGVRDIKGYNEKIKTVEEYNDENYKKLPQIVIIVDELADLMMVAPGEVEDAICRLAQLARACGIHLVIATQRPSVNVITGLIKANIPSRIAFSVSSAIDSRTILDGSGAEKLLGKGDMLFFPSGFPKPVRIQGAFISDKEVSAVVEYLSEHNEEPAYSEEVTSQITSAQSGVTSGGSKDYDDYFTEAGKFIIEKDKASIGMLQRVFKIGFNRAARIMDQLSEAGVVGPEEGTKPRKVIMSLEEFEQYIEECV